MSQDGQHRLDPLGGKRELWMVERMDRRRPDLGWELDDSSPAYENTLEGAMAHYHELCSGGHPRFRYRLLWTAIQVLEESR